jgi:hypothetical protein
MSQNYLIPNYFNVSPLFTFFNPKAYSRTFDVTGSICINKLKNLQINISHDSNFTLNGCKMSLTVDINSQFSRVQYSVNNIFVQGQDNNSNRYYTLSDQLKFTLSDTDKAVHSSLPFSYKNDQGGCLSSENKTNFFHLNFGQNHLFSCFLELNKNQFVEFCKSQDSYPILSTLFWIFRNNSKVLLYKLRPYSHFHHPSPTLSYLWAQKKKIIN